MTRHTVSVQQPSSSRITALTTTIMLEPTAALWVSVYIILIHLLCAILRWISRTSKARTRINGFDFDHPRGDTGHHPCEKSLEWFSEENHSRKITGKYYQFPRTTSCSGYIEEPQSEDFSVHERFSDSGLDRVAGRNSIFTERHSTNCQTQIEEDTTVIDDVRFDHEGEKKPEATDPGRGRRPDSFIKDTYFEAEHTNGHHHHGGTLKSVDIEKVLPSSNRAVDGGETKELSKDEQSEIRKVMNLNNASGPKAETNQLDQHLCDEIHNSSEESDLNRRKPIQWSSYRFSFGSYHDLGCSNFTSCLEIEDLDIESVDLKEETNSECELNDQLDDNQVVDDPQNTFLMYTASSTTQDVEDDLENSFVKYTATSTTETTTTTTSERQEEQKETRSCSDDGKGHFDVLLDDDDGDEHFTWTPSTQSFNLEEEDSTTEKNDSDDDDEHFTWGPSKQNVHLEEEEDSKSEKNESDDDDDEHFNWGASKQSVHLEEEHDDDDLGSDLNELADDDYLKNFFVQYTTTTKETTTSDNHDNEEYPQVQEVVKGQPYGDAKDDDEDFDVLLEHQSLVQQLKKEMKHSRNLGLPTILEESESFKLHEGLKPLKIDEKNKHKDQMEEIKRFYMSYSAKMRKLDISCHQTMYAAGLIQMKNQNQLLTTNKDSSIPMLTSLLPPVSNTNIVKRESSDLHDGKKKLFDGMNRNLDLVYIAQVCLSWEILKWQHGKSEELQLYDPSMTLQYTLVAKEFQRFQVLIERFTEDEVFLGPRIQTYVNSRYVNRNFLQVPIVKDDGKSWKWEEGDEMIVITKMTKIIEESMSAFCEFILADKNEEHGGLKLRSWQGTQTRLEDPSDAELLTRLQIDFQKKERKLKGLVKSRNCIVKKFQKQQDLKWCHEIMVAQVEVRLVSRALGMSRLTRDQLLWCHEKLSKINFKGRRIHIESSFLLFPC